MSGPGLDPYASHSPARSPLATGLRWSARAAGILVGLATSAYGFALYALRCFDTCPADPAEDKISQFLTVSIMLLGLVAIVAAVSVGTRWFRFGSWAATVLGAAIGLAGAATLALVPSLQGPGGSSGPLGFGVVALVVGAACTFGSARLRRGRAPQDPP